MVAGRGKLTLPRPVSNETTASAAVKHLNADFGARSGVHVFRHVLTRASGVLRLTSLWFAYGIRAWRVARGVGVGVVGGVR